jgi:hypothetical protein
MRRDREECERQRRVDCDRPEVIDDGPRQVIIVPSRRLQQQNLAPPPAPKPADPPVARVKPEALGKSRPAPVAK